MDGPHQPRSRGHAARATILVVALALVSFAPAFAAAVAHFAAPAGSPNPTVDYVNVTATSTYSFVPATFAVFPGALVHLAVTQGATFNHTFTLSAQANTTVPSPGYFSTHAPLVNISLGSTKGTVYYRNFTAPAIGTYEFICELHYTLMTGTMTSTTAPPPPPSSAPFPWGDVAIGAVVVVIVAAIAVAIVRRRRFEI